MRKCCAQASVSYVRWGSLSEFACRDEHLAHAGLDEVSRLLYFIYRFL